MHAVLLHALSLQIMHPTRGQPVRFAAPPPEEFVAAAAALGVPSDALSRLHSEAGATWEPAALDE